MSTSIQEVFDAYLVADRVCITIPCADRYLVSATDTAITIDHSASMGFYNGRADNAKRVAAAIAEASRNTAMYGFGNSASPVTVSTYKPLQQGTYLAAAATAMLEATAALATASKTHNATVAIITDCEDVKDFTAAIEKLRTLRFHNRRYLLVGLGPQASIHALMALIPPEHAEQGFYVAIPDGYDATVPVKDIHDALHAVSVQYYGTTVFVKPGASYLVPAGVPADAVHVDGRPLLAAGEVLLQREVTRHGIDALACAVASTVTRCYNGTLSMRKAVEFNDPRFTEHLFTIRELVRTELSFLESLLAPTDIQTRAAEVAEERSRSQTPPSALTMTPEVASRRAAASLRCRSLLLQNLSGAQELLKTLREIKTLVDGPIDARAYAEAARLFNATSRGNMSMASLSRLENRVAERQDLTLYNETHKLLVTLTPDGGTFPHADAFDAYARTLPDWPFADVITTDEDGSLVAVGFVERRPLVGAMNPCVTSVHTVDSDAPYNILAVHALNTDFRSAVGQVNSVVGVFPGNSQASAVTFRVMTSVIGTGSWSSPTGGQLGLFSLLVGVERLLKSGRMQAAKTLSIGWAGVAARLKTRVLQANGQCADSAAEYMLGLAAADQLLVAAAEVPCEYLGPQIMRPGLWTALDYAMDVAHSVLGTVPAWDRAALKTAIDVQKIVEAASWACQPISATDDADYDAETQVILTAQRTVYARLGHYDAMEHASTWLDSVSVSVATVTTALRPALRTFIATPLPYTRTTETPDGLRENVKEADFLDTYTRHLMTSPEQRPAIRAAFWTAFHTNAKRLTPAIMEAYADPAAWQASIPFKAHAVRTKASKTVIAALQQKCETAFHNATDNVLPLTFFDARSIKLVGWDGQVFEDAVGIGNDAGPCSGMRTGVLKTVCTALDSPHFLQKNSLGRYMAGRYMAATYAGATSTYAVYIPAFHATMTSWFSKAGITSPVTATTLACGTWPGISPTALGKYIQQWFFQRKVYDLIKAIPAEAVVPSTADIIAVARINTAAPEAGFSAAADWGPEDTSAREEAYGVTTAACTSLLEWSYEVAVVEFYKSLRYNTDTTTGVFDTRPYLTLLKTHRCFVLPRRTYDASVLAHGAGADQVPMLSATEYASVVDNVYTTLSCAKRTAN